MSIVACECLLNISETGRVLYHNPTVALLDIGGHRYPTYRLLASNNGLVWTSQVLALTPGTLAIAATAD